MNAEELKIMIRSKRWNLNLAACPEVASLQGVLPPASVDLPCDARGFCERLASPKRLREGNAARSTAAFRSGLTFYLLTFNLGLKEGKMYK